MHPLPLIATRLLFLMPALIGLLSNQAFGLGTESINECAPNETSEGSVASSLEAGTQDGRNEAESLLTINNLSYIPTYLYDFLIPHYQVNDEANQAKLLLMELPDELLIYLRRFLNRDSKKAIKATCKRWHGLIHEEVTELKLSEQLSRDIIESEASKRVYRSVIDRLFTIPTVDPITMLSRISKTYPKLKTFSISKDAFIECLPYLNEIQGDIPGLDLTNLNIEHSDISRLPILTQVQSLRLPNVIKNNLSCIECRISCYRDRTIRKFKNAELFKKFPNINYLYLSGPQTTLNFLSCLTELSSLKVLRLNHCNNLFKYTEFDDRLGRVRYTLNLLSYFQNLEFLDLSHTEMSDSDFGGVPTLTSLRSLNLSGNKISNTSLKILSRFENLQSLWINRTLINNEGMNEIGVLQTLTHLSLSSNTLESPERESIFKSLSKLTRLCSLELCRTGVSHAPTSLKSMIANLSKLESLHLGNSPVGDSFIANLTPLGNLRSLILSHTAITDLALTHLSNFLFLHTLDLSRTRISAAKIHLIAQLTHLSTLKLDSSSINTAALIALSPLRKLHTLSLKECRELSNESLTQLSAFSRLEHLFLDHTPISSDGIANLPPIWTLLTLSLNSTRIDDRVFPLLSKFPELKHLFLRHTTRLRTQGVLKLSPFGNWHLESLDFTDSDAYGLSTDDMASLKNHLSQFPNLKL